MHKITPFLWFNGNVEDAVNFYQSVFKDFKPISINRMGEGGPVMSATFIINGQEFMALNGGPVFSFTPGISFFIHVETQDEVDYYWDKLTAGGKEERCGWLKDKFGLSWQVIPSILGKLLSDKDRAKANRATDAMLKMNKINIRLLQEAAESSK